ncbi:MAG: DUF2384 domain-containing protein [bacterium]|nr:DUF2384 domain-containing protein [bacterium]
MTAPAVKVVTDISRSVALKAVGRIAERWGLGKPELARVLGMLPARTVRDWFERDRNEPLPHDVVERISHLIGIYDGLHRLFGDDAYADRWIAIKNEAFGSREPRELLLSGSFTALVDIRRYVERALQQ